MENLNNVHVPDTNRSPDFGESGKRIKALALATGLALMSACKIEERDNSENADDNQSGLAVGFDRSGGYVTFDTDDDPVFTTVDTLYPVLHFTGSNLDNTAVAYTSLAKLKMGAPFNREAVSHEASLALTLDDLVPTGELVIEKDGEAFAVSRPDEVATSATWSTKDPSIIAYTYAHADKYGIAVADIDNRSSEILAEGDFAPDFLAWSDDGESIGLNVRDESLSEDEYDFKEFPMDAPMHWQDFSVEDGRAIFDGESSYVKQGIMPSVFDPSMEIKLSQGSIITQDTMGGEEVAFDRIDENGNVLSDTLRVDQLRHRSKKGIAYVNADENSITLFATNGVEDPMPVAYAAAVTYYLPNPKGSTVNLVQVGQGYSSYCSASGSYSHTASSSMAYAIDIQLPQGSSYDKVQTSAAGSTYGWGSSATCNSYDTSNCASYSSSCSAYSGWGNYVIMSHSDGYYTKSTHLEKTNFKVVTSACVSAAKGCWIADEGHTGASAGNKYDTSLGSTYKCGDHLHFQRQSGGETSSSSITVSFSETGTPTSKSCKSYSPVTSVTTCSL